MNKLTALLLAAIACSATAAVNVNTGSVTEDVFRTWDRESQAAYVSGVLDGFYAAPMFAAAADVRLSLFETCLSGLNMTVGSVAELTRREIDADPALWSYGANMAVFRALNKACRAHGYRTE